MTSASISGDSSSRPWILISAYDISVAKTSEGFVAYNLIRQLRDYRIIAITRANNKESLKSDASFLAECPHVKLIGFDLPYWLRWWKRGGRLYQLYAYLWQMCWPLEVRKHPRLRQRLDVVHVLNFHNDSIPSLAWMLERPLVWGPINHNEVLGSWRLKFWPTLPHLRHLSSFCLRLVMWRFDPFLKLLIRRSQVILSAGSWVDERLRLEPSTRVVYRSQLGVDEHAFPLSVTQQDRSSQNSYRLIYAGRLDWIKGVDLAIEALALLPTTFKLTIIGHGPAEKHLRDLATRLGLDERIAFCPPVLRHELSDEFGRADMFIFPSAEAAGLTWVEALASGLRVVAFDDPSEVTSAAARLPGITLAESQGTRQQRVRALAFAIEKPMRISYKPHEVRTAVLHAYGWHALAVSVRHSYQDARRLKS